MLGAAPWCCLIADDMDTSNQLHHYMTHNSYNTLLSYIWFTTKENKMDSKKKKSVVVVLAAIVIVVVVMIVVEVVVVVVVNVVVA